MIRHISFKNLAILALIGIFGACTSVGGGSKDTLTSAIKTAEDAMYGDKQNLEFDSNKAQNLVNAYSDYAAAFPQDTLTANYLFKSAEVLRSLRKFDDAVNIYQQIGKDYPNYEKAPHSLFLLGFSYENDMKRLKDAEQVYKQFLAKYPSHELADDVQFSLNNLGKSPEEIIKEFERRRKEQQANKGGA